MMIRALDELHDAVEGVHPTTWQDVGFSAPAGGVGGGTLEDWIESGDRALREFCLLFDAPPMPDASICHAEGVVRLSVAYPTATVPTDMIHGMIAEDVLTIARALDSDPALWPSLASVWATDASVSEVRDDTGSVCALIMTMRLRVIV